MKVDFNEALIERTKVFCDDELNYHINECSYAEEYNNEILAEIEILYRIGYEDLASDYYEEYARYLNMMIEHRAEEKMNEFRMCLEELNKVWDGLRN